jgi:hypothetical protein
MSEKLQSKISNSTRRFEEQIKRAEQKKAKKAKEGKR